MLEAVDTAPKVHGIGPRVGEQGRAHVAQRPDGSVLAPELRPEQALLGRRELFVSYGLDEPTRFERLHLGPRAFERVSGDAVTRQRTRIPRIDDREHLGTEVDAQLARFCDGAEAARCVGRPLPDVQLRRVAEAPSQLFGCEAPAEARADDEDAIRPVSYTHLTLPTILLV